MATAATAPGLDGFLAGIVAAPEGFVLATDRAWSQGRTLFGGATTSACVAVAHRAFADLPPLRSAQVAFVGPASGRLSFAARELRRGRNSALLQVDAGGADGPAVATLLAFGAAKPSRIAHVARTMPAVPPPDACRSLFGDARTPRFLDHFDVRLASGDPPIAGSSATGYAAWVRFRTAPTGDRTTALVALADALPPAALMQYRTPARISSQSWTLEIVAAGDPGDWHLLEVASDHAADGYSHQAMAAWGQGGEPRAFGRQLVALFE